MKERKIKAGEKRGGGGAGRRRKREKARFIRVKSEKKQNQISFARDLRAAKRSGHLGAHPAGRTEHAEED